MKIRARVTGGKVFSKRLIRFPQVMERTMESLLRQEARGLAVEYGSATLPLGMQTGGGDKMKARIDREVRQVYVTKRSMGQILRVVERRSPKLVKAIGRALAQGKTAQVKRYLLEAGIKVDALDESELKAARTGPSGNVPKNFRGTSVVQENQLRALSKRQQAKGGTAKAGWHQAAKGLGGRTRVNTVETGTGKRGTAEAFPEYVRKVSRKYTGLGGARISTGTGRCSVTIFSAVRHAREAMDDGMAASARDRAQAKLRNALVMSLRIQNARIFRGAA